jgi:hypothetical protein
MRVRYTCWQDSYSSIAALGRSRRADRDPKPLRTASCQAHVPRAMLALWARCLANEVSYAQHVPKFCGRRVLLLSLYGEKAARGVSPRAEG